MKKWLWVVVFVCLVVATAAYILYSFTPAPVPPAALAVPPSTTSTPAVAVAQPAPPQPAPAVALVVSMPPQQPGGALRVSVASPALGPAAEVVPEPEPVGLPPATVLSNMRRTVRQYGDMFGGNPVGTNPEITRALNGDNPRHVIFLKLDGNRVNENGELIDSWGTPYFFHQLSSTDMEIRSAGPDRIMYTSDDLVTK